MDEYIIDVVINGKNDKLKTYCSSIYSAIDTMIGIDMVEGIKNVTRTKDNKSWDINDMNIIELRELRGHIAEIDLQNAFKNVEEIHNEI
tara:strand:- start:217 stop:483 length:267 start_codon:yes stop_codon:yes gene_type:complete